MGKKKNTTGKIVNQKPQAIKVQGNQYYNDEENANTVAPLNRSPATSSTSSNSVNTSEGSHTAQSPTATANSGGAPPKATNRTTPNLNPYAKILSIGQVALPPPPLDPVFVLRGAASSVTCVQFLAPPLRLSDLTPSQTEVLRASYRNPDAAEDAIYELGRQCGGGSTPLLKLPPPGFLSPTKHIAAGLQNGQIIIWDLKSKQQVACWQAHPPESAVLAIKSLSPTRLVSLGRRDCLKLWSLESAQHDVGRLSPTKDKSPASPHGKGSANKTGGSSPESSDSVCGTPPKEKTSGGSSLAEGGKEGVSSASKETPLPSKLGSLTAVCKTHISLGEYLGFSACDVFRHVNCIVAAIPGGPQDAVSVWSVDNRIKICQLRVNETSKVGSVMQLKWIEKKAKVSLLVAYESGDLCLWDWSNRDLHSVACIQGTPVSLEYDQSLGSGVLGTTEDGIFIFSISSNLELTIIKEITVTNEGLGCCISRPDGKIYATGGWDNRIRIFSWQKHKPLAVLDYHANSVSCLHYSASRVASCDGAGLSNVGVGPISAGAEHVLAAGSLDGSVSLWKIY